MRTTASYDLFPDAPSERAMARARWLAREGRVADAESAYRDVLATHPDLKPCWAEYFELLRTAGRPEDALRLAEEAAARLGAGAFPLALKGAALIELARFPDALAGLERAVEAHPHLALVWHELGHAAHPPGHPHPAPAGARQSVCRAGAGFRVALRAGGRSGPEPARVDAACRNAGRAAGRTRRGGGRPARGAARGGPAAARVRRGVAGRHRGHRRGAGGP